MSAPADTVTQNTAVADQMEEESMSLSDNTGEIQCINYSKFCYVGDILFYTGIQHPSLYTI